MTNEKSQNDKWKIYGLRIPVQAQQTGMPVRSLVKNQFHLRRFLSLSLLAGSLVFVTMTLTLGEISEDVTKAEPITVADARFSNWLHGHGTPFLTKAMLATTLFGSTAAVSCMAVVFGLYLFWRRRFYWLAALVPAVFGGMLLNRLLKYAFQRPRPFFDDPILTLTGYSFPSGHTMMATTLYGMLAAYVFATTSNRRRRALVLLAAGLMITSVAFSRIYLGAHYLSDVLGALAEGLAWLSLCLTVVYSVWRRGEQRFKR